MQIDPTSIERANLFVPIERMMARKTFYQIAYYISISYYAIATELRLMSNSPKTDPTYNKDREIVLEKSKLSNSL